VISTVRQLELVPLPPRPQRGVPLVACRIPIRPQVAKRPLAMAMRSDRTKSGWAAHVYDEPTYAAWKVEAIGLLVAYWAGRAPIRAALIAQVILAMPRPLKAPRWLIVRGEAFRYPFPWTEGRNYHLGVEDLDNLRKGPLDVLVQAGVLADDRLVVEDGGSRKVYAGAGEEPCVEIRVWSA